jgi:hypothetical protein
MHTLLRGLFSGFDYLEHFFLGDASDLDIPQVSMLIESAV